MNFLLRYNFYRRKLSLLVYSSVSFDKCNHHYTGDLEQFHHTQRLPRALCSQVLVHPQPMATTDLFSVLRVLSSQRCHINEIMTVCSILSLISFHLA